MRCLAYLALAAPAILLPQLATTGIYSTRFNLGWPIAGMDILLGGIDDGRILHFQPNILLPLVAGLWTYLASLGWRARGSAMARPDWRGAFVQAALTSLYCLLVLFFLCGVIDLIWEWQLSPMNWPELARALIFSRAWLPYLYAVGAGLIFLTLVLDARKRRGFQWCAHLVFVFCFAFLFWWLSPYLRAQLQQFDEAIQIVRKEQLKLP